MEKVAQEVPKEEVVATSPEPKQEDVDYKVCLKVMTNDGYYYTEPVPKEVLEKAVIDSRAVGTVCVCAIKPLCEVEVSVRIPWDKAKRDGQK